jgi:uncharacterized protein YbbC (DUF1343 family)
MEEAARRGIKIFILDRPNPIGAAGAAGPILDPALESFTGYYPLPVQHGLTLGELASLFNAEKKIGSDLTVVPMRGYQRRSWYDDSGLPWIAPSPNLRSMDETILYPGVGLIEGANVSVGRGTSTPFEIVGAPWINGAKLLEILNSRAIPGVRFELAAFTPAEDRYAGQPCNGIRIILTDRHALNAPRLGIEIASSLLRLHPGKFEITRITGGVGSSTAVNAIERGDDPQSIVALWTEPLVAFEALQGKYRLYP